MLLPPSPNLRPPVLESIYNVGGGKQSPLARYLASAGGGGAAPRQLGPGERAPLGASIPYEVNQDGSYTQPTPPASGPQAPGPAGQNPAAPPGLPGISTDYSSDPVLQQILSGNIRDEGDADASALAARRNVLGRYGDKNLAMAILGENDPTVGSISDDPNKSTSTLARLHRGFNDASKQTDDADSAGNIFYGGAHITNRANLAKDEQTNEADANASVHDALDQIAGGLRTTKSNIASTRAQAEQDAASRAAESAILAALLGGGSGASNLPPDGSTPGSPDTGAPTTTTGGVTYAGWPNQGDQIPTSPDTSNMTPDEAVAAQQAYAAALEAYTLKRNAATASAPSRI